MHNEAEQRASEPEDRNVHPTPTTAGLSYSLVFDHGPEHPPSQRELCTKFRDQFVNRYEHTFSFILTKLTTLDAPVE